MVSRKIKLFFIIVITLICSGCTVGYGDSLLVAPKLPKEYNLLQQKLDEIKKGGLTFGIIETGEKQSVKLIDLDADGKDEVVAFFRSASGEHSMYVFLRTQDDYELIDTVAGSGTSIKGVYYPERDDAGNLVIAVTWGLEESTTISGLTVYGYDGESISTMLETQYVHMDYMDVVGDGGAEFIIVSRDQSANKVAGLYRLDADRYSLVSSAPLCTEASTIRNIQVGKSAGGGKAIFIDSMSENGKGYVSDVINVSTGQMENETIDVASLSGAQTYRETSVFCKDINGDGVIDIPSFWSPEDSGDMEGLLRTNKVSWYSFSAGMIMDYVGTTYHSPTGEWFMNWPDDWGEEVLIMRNSSMYMVRTEFYIPLGESGEDESQTERTVLFNVIEFFGDNRYDYMNQYSNLTVLKTTSQKIFCYSMPTDIPAKYALTEEMAKGSITIEID